MPTHWNTAIERLDEGKILEDILPKRDKYSFTLSTSLFSVTRLTSGMRQSSSLILKSTYAQEECFNEVKHSFKGLSCYHCDYDILVII